MTRPDEALLSKVVVEDPGTRKVLLGLERIEHEDALLPGKAGVVKEIEPKVTHLP